MNQLPYINILTSAYGCAILNDINSADKPEQIKLQEIHRNYNLHFGKLKNKKKGGHRTISDINIHPETLSSNILRIEKNIRIIINMKDNSRETGNKNKTIDYFQEIKYFYKKTKYHKVFKSRSTKNKTPRGNGSKLIILKLLTHRWKYFVDFLEE